MEKISNIGIVTILLEKFSGKGAATNNFLLSVSFESFIKSKALFYIATKSNLYFLVLLGEYYQLYFHINDLNELFQADIKKPVTMEILYRGEKSKPIDIINFWERSGFKQHQVRDMMTASYSQLRFPDSKNPGISIKYADSASEAFFTKQLIESSFDRYTGDILTIEEVDEFVEKGNVICAYWHGSICGILQFEIKNNVVWIGHIAIASAFRGKGIANELVKVYIVDNAKQQNTRYQLWVMQNNPGAIALYKKFGFIYGNKSSASMLKL